jgi:hypothetical protein
MQRQPVDSSSLASVGYEEPTRILEVEFHNGGVYQYLGVPSFTFRALMAAESRGAFLNTRIKPFYHYVRLEPASRGVG